MIAYVSNANAEGLNKFPDYLTQLGINHEVILDYDSLRSTNFETCKLLISDRCSFLFSEEFIKTSQFPMVNVHPSLLPFHKGAHPIFWSTILNHKWGISVHLINPGIDDGPIVHQREIQYSDDMTFRDLYAIYRQVAFEELQALTGSVLEGQVIHSSVQPRIAEGKHLLKRVTPLILRLSNSWDTPIKVARIELEHVLKEVHYPVLIK